jgi:branched-chain amino acid transport system substrate-binding protein
VPLRTGTLMIGLPEWADIAAPAAVAAIKAGGAEPEGYALPAYAAVEIALAANADARSASIADGIARGDFSTAIGPFSFDGKGDLRQSLYRLFRFDGTRFVEAGTQ